MEYDLLNEINTSKEEWSTRVRVCRLWESKNFKNNNEVISLDMVLMDAKGNMMHATVRKGLMSKFKHLLQEGRVYGIKDFKVVPTNGHYQPITGDFKIFFMNCTSVTRKEDEDPEIATYGFQFVDWATMQSRLNKNSVLTDVMGCLSAIGGIEIVGVDKKKRELEIITQDDMHAKITLWGITAENFDPSSYEHDGPFILIATSTAVKEFQGQMGFSITGATKLYVNLNIPEVQSMSQRFLKDQIDIKILPSPPVNETSLHDQMFPNLMTLKDLLEKDWPAEIEEQYVTVRATVTDIDSFFGWYYISCFDCNRKVLTSNGAYKCLKCNKEFSYPLFKYKIHLKVADMTATSTFIIFNKEAEKLLDSSASKFLNRDGQNVDSVPVEVHNLCGKNYIFKLKLNSYNLKEGMENYTISKVYKPDEEVEYESIDKKLKNTIPNECISKEEVDVATNDDKGLIMKRKCVIDDPDEEKMHVKKRPLSARKRKLKVFDLEG